MAKDVQTKREREKALVSEMIFHHPVAAIRHVIETKKEKRRMERGKE